MRLQIGFASDVGRVRDGNEDAFLVDERMGLVAVADGMGGHRAGEVASATAIESLRANVASGMPIRDAIANANQAVFTKAEHDESLQGMGTTVTAGTLATGDTLLVGHVGDSRLYLLRGGDLHRVTDDHSLVEELVREGRLTPEQAAVHPQRSTITRALGVDASVDVDVYPIQLRVGDRLVFCSDGLTTMVRDENIATVLRRERDPQRAANQLVADANEAGGEDNVTVVVVDAEPGESLVERPAALPPELAHLDADDDGSRPEPEGERMRVAEPAPPPRRRRIGRAALRVALWALPILAVLGLAVGVAGWYARRTYFVTITDDRVVLYKGRPGGAFGWDPTVEEVTDVRRRDLTSAQHDDLEGEVEFSSRADADEYLDRLELAVERRSTATTTTTRPTPPAGSGA